MLEENEVVWVQDGFTGAWEPLESFTREELELLSAGGAKEMEALERE